MRVLQAVSSMNAGGIETLLMSVFRAIDRSRIQFDFLYRTEDPCLFDEEIVSLGGRIHRVVPGFGAQRKLRSVFLENRYQIAHFHYSRLAYMEPYDVAGRCGVPTRIVHSHCTRSVTPDMRSRIAESLHKFNRARVRDAVRFACSRDAASWFGFDRPGGGGPSFRTLLMSVDSRLTMRSGGRRVRNWVSERMPSWSGVSAGFLFKKIKRFSSAFSRNCRLFVRSPA